MLQAEQAKMKELKALLKADQARADAEMQKLEQKKADDAREIALKAEIARLRADAAKKGFDPTNKFIRQVKFDEAMDTMRAGARRLNSHKGLPQGAN
jgi:uncharacterized small protein (DUF1192 family)